MKSNVIIMAWLLLGLISCQPTGNQTQSTAQATEALQQTAIQSPYPSADVSYQHFEIDPSQEQHIKLPNGTQIFIPANAIVDGKGQPVQGPVDLRFRDFYEATEIFASGIPMTYGAEVFKTGGMMEIRAYQNQEALFLAEGKAMNIALAMPFEKEVWTKEEDNRFFTDTGDNYYRPYYLDEENGIWQEMSAPDSGFIQVNSMWDEASKALDMPKPDIPSQPIKPEKPDPNGLIVNFELDYDDYPELKPFENIEWQYVDVGDKKSADPIADPSIFDHVWTDAKIFPKDPKKGIYYIGLKRRAAQVRFTVKPVMEGDDYDNSMKVYSVLKAQYEEAQQRKLEAERRRKEAQKQFKNSARFESRFIAPQFGFYNCDRFYQAMNPQVLAVDFKVKLLPNTTTTAEINKLFHLVLDQRVSIPYNRFQGAQNYSWAPLTYSPQEQNALIAVLANGDLAMIKSSDFERLVKANTKVWELEHVNQKYNAPRDLRVLLTG